jgi:hypothetical protein
MMAVVAATRMPRGGYAARATPHRRHRPLSTSARDVTGPLHCRQCASRMMT